jgi:hypothetical protein
MRKRIFYLIGIVLLISLGISCNNDDDSTDTTTSDMIIDHTCTDLSKIPETAINKAITDLYIVCNSSYWHSSEIIYGLYYLGDFKGSLYDIDEFGNNGRLHFDARDAFGQDIYSIENRDNDSAWYKATRDTLTANTKINAVMWCWADGVSDAKSTDIDSYLGLMSQLEKDFTSVKFVYMTGHLDGTSKTDNLYLRNEQIRKYCKDNKKILFDFADIESYDPDGVYYGEKLANDTCGYDSNGDKKIDKNWATDWMEKNKSPKKWYECRDFNRTPYLNSNLKAYAAWWMFARMSGWAGPAK